MGAIIKAAWDRASDNTPETAHHFLFGSPASTAAVTTMHPDQARIFRLWQVYLDNVNPLLKVTHTPTLQARIIDAMGNLGNVSAPLEALMFSIYCLAVLSLTNPQCESMLGSPKRDLLSGYQFACRHALLNCNVLQSSDHDCLTALFLYLVTLRTRSQTRNYPLLTVMLVNQVSIKPSTDPRALSSLLAVAIHGVQRLGYHREAMNTGRPVLEGELRRRLWWALVSFEHRVCETYNHRTTTLSVAWNCHVPLNLNDFELLPGTKIVPPTHDRPTEALFVLLRSQLADCLRRSPFHLDLTDPYLTTLAAPAAGQRGSPADLGDMQHALEKTLSLCDVNHNPLHFIAAWSVRGFLAKCLLLEYTTRQHRHHNSRGAGARANTGAQGERDGQGAAEDEGQGKEEEDEQTGLTHALTMLRCDTTLLSSPMTLPFRWYIQWNFPFLAYAYIVQYLIVSRPRQGSSGQAQGRGQAGQTRQRPQRQQQQRKQGKGRGGPSANSEHNGDDYGVIAKRCWDVMTENYEARGLDFAGRDTNNHSRSDNASTGDSERFEPLFRLFAGVILRGWDHTSRVGNRDNNGSESGGQGDEGDGEVPRIVTGVKKRLREMQAARGVVPGMGGADVGRNGGDGSMGVGTGMPGVGIGMEMASDVGDVGQDGSGQGFMGGLVIDQGGYSIDLMMGNGQMGLVDMQQQFWPGADWVM